VEQLILGIDAGNYQAKVAGSYGTDSFRTAICDWFERDVVESFGEDDMEFEVGNRKGFAGTIAVYEDVYGGEAMYGDSKAHDDTKVRVLLAIYRYIKKYDIDTTQISIVVGQPIKKHVREDKKQIQQMLKGTHSFIVNGEHTIISIINVGVAPEGSGSFWSNPADGTIRIIDVGSGTVNAATVIFNRHVNTASDTFNFGIETIDNKDDLSAIARGIIRGTTRLKWNRSDKVLVCGGIANRIIPFIAEHYHLAQVSSPILKGNGKVTIAKPTFANAIGFYEIAKGAFS
jgi:plasmid segregation protein ParM